MMDGFFILQRNCFLKKPWNHHQSRGIKNHYLCFGQYYKFHDECGIEGPTDGARRHPPMKSYPFSFFARSGYSVQFASLFQNHFETNTLILNAEFGNMQQLIKV